MRSLLEVLERASTIAPSSTIVFHDEQDSTTLTYRELHSKATENARVLTDTLGVSVDQIILLHLDSHADYVTWFWSVIAAGAIPAVSTPLPVDENARDRHLQHLQSLLRNPMVLTRTSLAKDFVDLAGIETVLIEDLTLPLNIQTQPETRTNGSSSASSCESEQRIAFMMLTSGSTGGAKAVEISHAQVLAALQGKVQKLETSGNDTFLNWIGFDHVACVTEIHLHAMTVCATQVHMAPKTVIQDPLLWLTKLAAHSATITFAPNFFLASVCKAADDNVLPPDLDLSKLRVVVSGGEANSVSTGIAFNKMARNMGATADVLCPAFGMTESCAGSIYNTEFPSLEIDAGLDFCSVGRTIHTMRIRITDNAGNVLPDSQIGNLELSGSAIFHTYHNDAGNTAKSFTGDGWFRTGDIGYTYTGGHLILSGRTKDSMIINGTKYFSHELEAAVEAAEPGNIVPSYTSAFSTWPKGSDSEEIVVTFLASERVSDDRTLVAALDSIAKATLLYCSKKPKSIIPLPSTLLCKTSLGKLSRSALKSAYELGKFDLYVEDTRRRMSRHRKETRVSPKTDTEKMLAELFAHEFGLDLESIGVEDSLVDVGVDSIRLLRFKGLLQRKLGLEREIPIGLLLTNPSIRGLAQALSVGNQTSPYDPVVVLQSGKARTPPIWFIHPGLGEILVFLNISRYFSDRRVYALRAPGFNSGEKMFESIDQMTDVYMDSIRQRQPNGPYILVGYSFGSMIAFETTKKLEAAGREVFMASLNGPAHIKWRMRQIDWCELFLNLSYFLGFITEQEAVEKSIEYHEEGATRNEVLSRIMATAPPEKLEELDLDEYKLSRWADISAQLQGLARDYDPTGMVKHIDVFFANPLLAVGRDKQVWLRQHLSAWKNFSSEEVCFHDSPGAHYTMLSPEHVFAMQKVLRSALQSRGIL
ncbi:hypothetical protein BJ170DRAFT_645580 [Xylariales sp. AK1849]|nr:hypothetical protein BJ170DRAFT_645580 [Xylariales sp. AK1849]